MTLSQIQKKKTLAVIGLNSGTSADSLDIALVKISRKNNKRTVSYLDGKTVRYPKELKKAILSICDTDIIALEDIIYLDNSLGQFYGRQANLFIKQQELKNITIDLISSHGQTVRHLPEKIKKWKMLLNGTMQLGSADFISKMTGKIVINDFRQGDIAIGNEGAPITTGALEILLGKKGESRLIVNIGGMSNYFYFPGNYKNIISAADCGPGNSLSDILSQKLFGIVFDKNGAIARKGNISERLLHLLLSNDFYKSKNKSTGRELFGLKMADEIVNFSKKIELSKYDILATVEELTSRSIVMKIKHFIKNDKKLKKLYLTGGGRNNIFMVDRLKYHLPLLEILPVDLLGIDGDLIEATSFAVMGEACLRSETINKKVTSSKNQQYCAILGKITQPPNKQNL